jgi:hypothetical protein
VLAVSRDLLDQPVDQLQGVQLEFPLARARVDRRLTTTASAVWRTASRRSGARVMERAKCSMVAVSSGRRAGPTCTEKPACSQLSGFWWNSGDSVSAGPNVRRLSE